MSINIEEDGKRRVFSFINLPVFISANLIIFGVLLVSVLIPDTKVVFSTIQSWIVGNAKWYYVLSVGIILGACIFLALSRFGDIRLGPDHAVLNIQILVGLRCYFLQEWGLESCSLV